MRKAVWFFIIALFSLFVTPHFFESYSQEMVIETDTPVGVENLATEGSVLKPIRVNYELPYPGMLPDNPFYIFKVVRDGIIKRLINDDMKMAKFSLLNAEKRMFAGRLLADKNKEKLAIETISKGNNYFNDTISAIKHFKKTHPKSIDVKPFLLQLDISTQKVLEIQNGIGLSIEKENKEQFKHENERTIGIQKIVKDLLKQN